MSTNADGYRDAEVAGSYESVRASKAAWQREQSVVEEVLRDEVTDVRTCLDVPTGTGRFLPVYGSLGWEVTAMDISSAMLDESRAKAASVGLDATFREGSVFELPFDDGSFDLVVCYRLLNWFNRRDTNRALAELARVSRRWIVVSERHQLIAPRAAASAVKSTIMRFRGQRASYGYPEVLFTRQFDRLGLTVRRRDVVGNHPNVMEHITWLLSVPGA